MTSRELFNGIYDGYFPKIYAYFSACFGRDVAEDLSQQTFLKIWRQISFSDFQKPEHILAWAFKIAINIKNDFFRSKYRRPQTEELADSLGAEAGTENSVSDQKLSIEKAFSLIKPEEKELLLLKGSGLNSEEIGAVRGISGSAVRSRLSTARKHLAKALADCGVNVDESK